MSGDARITDPGDMDVYFIGAGGIWSRIVKNSTRDGHVGSVVSTHDANLNGLDAGSIFKIGEKEVSTAPLTISEKADLEWIELQRARNSNCARVKGGKMNKSSYVVPDNTPLISFNSDVTLVCSDRARSSASLSSRNSMPRSCNSRRAPWGGAFDTTELCFTTCA